jgi:polar amino acid transport system substrate-binding protein
VKRYIAVCQLIVVLLVCVQATGVGLAASVRSRLTEESTLEKVMRRGVLKVGMSTFVPWAMNDKNGNLVGFEIDVAKRLARDMGVKVEFVPTNWAGIIPALLTGKFDIIIGGMGIRPERNLKVNFSDPYDYTGQSLVANKKLAPGLTSLEQFNRPDFTISVRLGSTSVDAVRKYLPKAKMVMFDDESQAYQEVINGRAQAMVGSAPTPTFQALKYPDILYLPFNKTFAEEPIGFAVNKGDYDTINFLNGWIRVVSADGFLRERKHYWFETTDWESMIK